MRALPSYTHRFSRVLTLVNLQSSNRLRRSFKKRFGRGFGEEYWTAVHSAGTPETVSRLSRWDVELVVSK